MGKYKSSLVRGGKSAAYGITSGASGIGHAVGAAGRLLRGITRGLENIVGHGEEGLEEAGKGIGKTIAGAGYIIKGTGRAIRGSARGVAHAGGNVKVPMNEAGALYQLSPTMRETYGLDFKRAVQRRKGHLKIFNEDYDEIVEEAMREQARQKRRQAGSQGYQQAAAVLFFMLSAFFLASTTPSITGYSILQAGAIYSYFPFFGAISLILAFVLLLTE